MGGGNRPGAGAGGVCVCPQCGHEMPHQVGVPCYDTKCPKCGATVSGGKFCAQCGAPLTAKKFCAECGSEIPAGAKFCPECGKAQK